LDPVIRKGEMKTDPYQPISLLFITTISAHLMFRSFRPSPMQQCRPETFPAPTSTPTTASSVAKARLRPMRGLKTDRTARVVIAGHAFMQNVRRGHYQLGVEAHPRLRVAAAFDELSLAI
jgi:hypothetical protein